MKLLLTIWLSAVLTQEVFSSALVRYPRHAVGTPTSSVHTEYEATYEQKGKHGNGSYSTVSGKQEVVHDNCHDNWNAFADKCATLIKDLVASLGNAVSSKPGDATNLQLRIRNTFKHFDGTDNCTCFAKNSLTSLFDNVTATTGQPVLVHEDRGRIVPSAQNVNGHTGQVQSITCEGESCNEGTGSGQGLLSASQQRRGQPGVTLTNAEDVDPENADSSKESSTTNSRRGVQYPGIIVKDPSLRSRGSGAAVGESRQSLPTSGSSTNRILSRTGGTSAPAKAIASPADAVVPTSQSQASTKTRPLKSITSSRTSAPQQSSFQSASRVYRPAKNNGIERSAIPFPPSSSGSKISSPETAAITSQSAGSGSGQATGVLSEAKTSPKGPVRGVEEVVPVHGEGAPTESDAASNQTPVTAPVVLTEPVNSAAAKPRSDSRVSSAANSARGQIPSAVSASESLSGALAEPNTISVKKEGDTDEDCDEEKGSEGSESVLTPVVPAEGSEAVISDGDNNEESVLTPVAPVAEAKTVPVNIEGDKDEECDEEKGPEGTQSVLTPVVPVAEQETVVSEGDKDEDCDEEKGSEPVLTPVAPVAEPETVVSEGDKDEDCDEEKGPEGSEIVLTPAVPVAEPETVVSEGDKDEDCDEEKGSEPVLTPVVPEEGSETAVNEGDKDEDCDEEKGPEGTQSVLTPVAPVAEAETVVNEGDKDEDCDEEKGSEPVLTPVAPVAEAETVVNDGDKDEDCDEEKGPEGSESVLTPVAPVAEPETVVSEGDKDEDCDEEKGSEPVLTPVVPEEGSETAVNEGDKDEDCDEEKGSEGSESVLTPVAPVAEAETVVNEGDKDEDCDEGNGSESEQIPVASPVMSAVEPQLTSNNAEGDSDDEGAAGNASNKRPVVRPVMSTFQDPASAVSDESTNLATNPKSSVVPAVPVSDSGDSEMPVITQAADSTNQDPLPISDDPAPPEIASASDAVNVNPRLIVKQPKQSQHSAQSKPPAKVPLINSNSNLPDSTGPVDGAGTVKPSPIYQSLPTAPSATPSSDSAVLSDKPGQPSKKQEVSKPFANEKATQSGAGQSISSVSGKPAAPASASQLFQGKGGKGGGEKVFIVTPVPVYPEKAVVKPAVPTEGSSGNGDPSKGSKVTEVEYTNPARGGGALGPAAGTLQAGNGRQETHFTTPIPVVPVVTEELNGDAAKHSASGKPISQQHPLFTSLGSKNSAGNQPNQITDETVVGRPPSPPPKVVKGPVVQTAENEDLTKPTTFQTTSTDPTPPQQSIQSPPPKNSVSLTRPTSLPQESFEIARGAPATSPQTPPHDDDNDDDEEEDCCSCESCTEEEVTNPKQYKEMACKDLEEARKELKAIFDKIKKRLKCGKKAPQKIAADPHID